LPAEATTAGLDAQCKEERGARGVKAASLGAASALFSDMMSGVGYKREREREREREKRERERKEREREKREREKERESLGERERARARE